MFISAVSHLLAIFFKEIFMHPTGISPEDNVVMEGYLFKRATHAFRTWNRRWFQIKENKLVSSCCRRKFD